MYTIAANCIYSTYRNGISISMLDGALETPITLTTCWIIDLPKDIDVVDGFGLFNIYLNKGSIKMGPLEYFYDQKLQRVIIDYNQLNFILPKFTNIEFCYKVKGTYKIYLLEMDH